MSKKRSKKLCSKKPNKTELDLKLIDEEINGSILSIIGLLIFIISANQDKQIILQKSMGNNTANLPDPSKTVLNGSEFIFISTIILANVAFTRLNEKKEELLSYESTSSLQPSINIASGYVFSLIANLLKLIGAQEKAAESGNQITLV